MAILQTTWFAPSEYVTAEMTPIALEVSVSIEQCLPILCEGADQSLEKNG